MSESFKDLMEDVSLVEPSPLARAIMDAAGSRRTLQKDLLKKVEDMCAWCGVVKVPDRRRKYCSLSCSHSSSCHFYPQSNASKAWILVNRQSCACAGCGLSYEEELLDRARKVFASWNKNYAPEWPRERVTYWRLGYGTGDKIQVDHVIPIHKGGAGVGLDNIQILCFECHVRKSADERRR